MTQKTEAIEAILTRTPEALGYDSMAPWLRSTARDKCADGEGCEAGHMAAAANEIERLRGIISGLGFRVGARDISPN